MTVKLTKLSVCACGYPTMRDGIPLGAVYEVEPTIQAACTYKCGGCGKSWLLVCIWVKGKDGGAPGFLPKEIFRPANELASDAFAFAT